MLNYSGQDPAANAYSNYVIYVNPRQYERICKRRAQRDRQLLRRGRSRSVYIPLAVRDDYCRVKRGRSDYEAPNLSFPSAGLQSQRFGLYTNVQYPNSYDYARPSGKIACTSDGSVASFSDVATLITGSSERGSYPGSVISGSTSHSRVSELSPNKDRSPAMVSRANECGTMDSYATVENIGSVESCSENNRAQAECVTKPELYAQLGSRGSQYNYAIPMRSGITDTYTSSSSSSSSTAATVVGGYNISKGATSALNMYPPADKSALNLPVGGEMYLPTKMRTEPYTRKCYYAGAYGTDSRGSESYSREGYAPQLDRQDYYTANSGSIMGYVSECYGTENAGEPDQRDHNGSFASGGNVPADISCGYAQHLIGDTGAFQSHIVTHGLVVNNNIVDAGSLQNPICNEYMYTTGADTAS